MFQGFFETPAYILYFQGLTPFFAKNIESKIHHRWFDFICTDWLCLLIFYGKAIPSLFSSIHATISFRDWRAILRPFLFCSKKLKEPKLYDDNILLSRDLK
jgi:hypothetical protein